VGGGGTSKASQVILRRCKISERGGRETFERSKPDKKEEIAMDNKNGERKRSIILLGMRGVILILWLMAYSVGGKGGGGVLLRHTQKRV